MAFSKPKLPETALSLLSFIALFLMVLVNKVHSEERVSFYVDSFYPSPASLLTYQGDAHVPAGDNYLYLTKTDSSGNPQSWSTGRVLFSSPVQFRHSKTRRRASFETTIKFYMKSTNGGAADGIAFFIAPVGSTIPKCSAGGNLAIFGSSGANPPVFAVEFDTFVNEWDPKYSHIGIDINSRHSAKNKRFENALDTMVTAHINYDVDTRMISVHATAGPQSFRLEYESDLHAILPEMVQVGISSSTGELASNPGVHEIHSWNFTSTLVPDKRRYNDQNENEDEDTYIREFVRLM